MVEPKDGKTRSEMIVAGLMLTFAMTRLEAELVLLDHEGEILTQGMQDIHCEEPPEYLRKGWFTWRRRMAWLEGRNSAVSAMFARLMRTNSKLHLRRQKEVRKPWATLTPTG